MKRNRKEEPGKRIEKHHTSQCIICNHPDKEKIEKKYIAGKWGQVDICDQYDMVDSSVSRHIKYFSLDLQRADNTRAVLKKVIARGLEHLDSNILEIKAADIIGATKHLDNLEGRVQAKRENEADLERRKVQYERAVESIIQRAAAQNVTVSREKAISLLEGQFPAIREVLA